MKFEKRRELTLMVEELHNKGCLTNLETDDFFIEFWKEYSSNKTENQVRAKFGRYMRELLMYGIVEEPIVTVNYSGVKNKITWNQSLDIDLDTAIEILEEN